MHYYTHTALHTMQYNHNNALNSAESNAIKALAVPQFSAR